MNAWLEENLKGFTSGLGVWLSWSYQKDNANDFFNPIICIYTTNMEDICEDMVILVKGQQYKAKFMEILHTKVLADRSAPMQLSSSCPVEGQNSKSFRNGHGDNSPKLENSTTHKNNTSGGISVVNVGSSVGEKENDSQNKPRLEHNEHNVSVLRSQNNSELDTSSLVDHGNFEGRFSTKVLGSANSSSEASALVSNSLEGEEKNNSHTSLCKDLQLLKMRGPVGRPKKRTRGVTNPFDIGCGVKRYGKRKTKGIKKSFVVANRGVGNEVKLKAIAEEVADLTDAEARKVVECAENLGLSVVKVNEATIKEVHILLQEGNL